ncbi:PTS sugar transporter subunit IIA [Hyphomicrobiales bacterium]|jgi:PTS system mannose-specific IIA component|nr:PTS sugar transporter subunit IIA [Rhodobiaceae bacterium]MDB4127853.1 PTS sugar transporter subunit IIA [Hyphomicrobiales bacterium]MBT5640345.1 PTS sugar transporter subunit IIA [Rhodobiaceae bacterium]MBT6222661.1 PTS sugar transporter subunit IIA [Rhodobiaceae bacterium]MDB4831381.1 PTS sugar transporter subunit IIA [Hyphomicrobiales bacterium]|tara:strand:- start:585 stop:986 length:402 start_codon:yes stop_codon:yes gene_type:complete
MIGIVIVSHGNLAGESLKILEHIVGKQKNIETISIQSNDSIKERRFDLLKSIENVDTGNGVIILSDMFGGTPSNLAISALKKSKIEVIAGFNLPMLITLASEREKNTLDIVVKNAQDAGRKYITIASQVLDEE